MSAQVRPDPDQHTNGLFDRVLLFIAALRAAGVTATQSEAIDAFHMVQHIDLQDRHVFQEGLAAVTVTSQAARRTFDELFELWFPIRLGGSDGMPLDQDMVDDEGEVDRDAFMEALVDALMDGDDADLRRMARQAVDAFGRVEGRDGEPSWFSYRVRRNLDPRTLMDILLSARDATDDSPMAQRLLRDEYEARLRTFQEEVDAEVRRRAADRQGVEDVARRSVRAPIEDVDFFRMSAAEAADLRTQIAPLARKLASRTQVKRARGRDGRLDVRRTVRRSLSTGGVPFDPSFKPRRPHKPELFVITDVSGSVASFARFTLMLVHALQEQFAKVRSFAFIDNLDEVTSLFDGRDFDEALRGLSADADLVWLDGHSDYGRALQVFHQEHARDVTAKSTVLVLGDARNNYRASSSWVLKDLQRRARKLYWLNPEARTHWGTGDSITAEYGQWVDEMVEVRNLRQLSAFVQELT